jgi:hypothetical protein
MPDIKWLECIIHGDYIKSFSMKGEPNFGEQQLIFNYKDMVRRGGNSIFKAFLRMRTQYS